MTQKMQKMETFTCTNCEAPDCPPPPCKLGKEKLCQVCADVFMQRLRQILKVER